MTKRNRIIRKTLRIILGVTLGLIFLIPFYCFIVLPGEIAIIALMIQSIIKMYLDDDPEGRQLAKVNIRREIVLSIRLAIWPITVWTDFIFGKPSFKISDATREWFKLRELQNQ